MAKKSKNFYERVKFIQDEYKKHKTHEGISDKWIFDAHIYPRFFISYTRFRAYLNMNVRALLTALAKEEKE